MRKGTIACLVLLVLVIVGSAWYASAHKQSTTNASSKLQIVAAENFWGSLASQIGGNKVTVLSIVSDPNADPHEYESNTRDARAVSSARLVIMNGADYDNWMSRLLSASANTKRRVLNVAELNNVAGGNANPHMWYNPDYANRTAQTIEQDIISLDPSNKAYYVAQYNKLMSGMATYQHKIAAIKQQYAGVKVAATEDIFVYLANACGLDLISPTAFMQAVAEGNDPPASSVITFQQQLQSKQPEILVYNEQTVTPLTTSMRELASRQQIPVAPVTETMPPTYKTFQDWMYGEVNGLQIMLHEEPMVTR